MKNVFKNTSLLLISTLLVTSTVANPQEVKTLVAAKTVEYGLPLPFVRQQRTRFFNSSQGDYPRVPGSPLKPVLMAIESPWKSPSQFLALSYLLNIAIVFSSLYLVISLTSKIYSSGWAFLSKLSLRSTGNLDRLNRIK